MTILAVDPGEKRIGLALSDPTHTLATPYRVLGHITRAVDAATIVQIANEQSVSLILVGQALNDEGLPTPSGRKAARLADAIRQQTDIPIELWDESFTTQDAKMIRLRMGAPRRKRGGHLDSVAAAVLLQSYLESHP